MSRGKGGIDKLYTFKQFCVRLYQLQRFLGRHYQDSRSYPIYITTNGYDLDYDTFQSAGKGIIIIQFNNCYEATANADWMVGQMYSPELYDSYDIYLDWVSDEEEEEPTD